MAEFLLPFDPSNVPPACDCPACFDEAFVWGRVRAAAEARASTAEAEPVAPVEQAQAIQRRERGGGGGSWGKVPTEEPAPATTGSALDQFDPDCDAGREGKSCRN